MPVKGVVKKILTWGLFRLHFPSISEPLLDPSVLPWVRLHCWISCLRKKKLNFLWKFFLSLRKMFLSLASVIGLQVVNPKQISLYLKQQIQCLSSRGFIFSFSDLLFPMSLTLLRCALSKYTIILSFSIFAFIMIFYTSLHFPL